MHQLDPNFHRDQLAIIRTQERAAWLEKQLTDEQRLEREKQRIALANGKLRGLPTCFGDL